MRSLILLSLKQRSKRSKQPPLSLLSEVIISACAFNKYLPLPQNEFSWQKQHDQVEKAFFPFDPDFPQYDLARQQMSGACGLLSFIIKANSIDNVETYCEGPKHIRMAVSWGGYESLIIPQCAGM